MGWPTLFAATDTIITSFFEHLLITTHLPHYATLISQLNLRAGGLGLLCPRTRAAPDFVLGMTSTFRNATLGFRLHRDLLPHKLHPSLQELFLLSTNPSSLILRRFHCLLPQFTTICSTPSTPHATRHTHFLTSLPLKTMRERINKFCTSHILNATYHEVYSNAPDHLHLLPSILAPPLPTP